MEPLPEDPLDAVRARVARSAALDEPSTAAPRLRSQQGQPDAARQVQALTDAVDVLLRAVGQAETRVAELDGALREMTGRVVALEAAERARGFAPWYSAERFDDAFRGTRAVILDRYRDIADRVALTDGPVLDLGCGRGELLELLQARGVPASGVEVVPELVALCTGRGLDVRLADAFSALAGCEDASLGAVTLIQVVEHVTAQQLVDLIALVRVKLRAGGIVVAETVNAVSPFVFTRSFYLDPTHTNPVHHAYLTFLLEEAGFTGVEVQWRSFVNDEEKVPFVAEPSGTATDTVVGGINRSILRLNEHLFPPQDYAVVATR